MYNGGLLKKIRLLKGLNQKGIAKKLGMTQQAYSKKENNGALSEKEFMHIMKFIGCSTKELEFVRNYPPPKNSY